MMGANKSISTGERHYIVSVRKENFDELKKSNFSLIGFPDRCKIADSLKMGDKLIVYVGSRVSVVAGIIEVASEMKYETTLLWDDIFPKRFKTKPLILLEEKKYLPMAKIKNGLSFIDPSIIKYGVYFMSGIKIINDEDYNYILKLCEDAK